MAVGPRGGSRLGRGPAEAAPGGEAGGEAAAAVVVVVVVVVGDAKLSGPRRPRSRTDPSVAPGRRP